MAKYRSSQDFAATYASQYNGIAGGGTDNFVHLQEETTGGTFVAPSVGTQGTSVSASSPSIDISAETDTNFRINVDGTGVTAITLVPAGKTSGALIAAHIETQVNTALAAAGYDARVWVVYTTVYTISSQKTGTTSTVVVTDGASASIADTLKIGVANGGTEAAGAYGNDFAFQTKCSLKVSQNFKPSEHKSGRQATSTIKEKKMTDGDIELYFNPPTSGVPSIDTPISLLIESCLGRRLDTGSTEIKFDGKNPGTKFYSIVQGNNAIGRYVNGGYSKSFKVALPGSGEAKMTIGMKARDGKYATIAQVNGAVAGSATVVVNNNESPGFEVGSRVMAVNADGRTVVAGQDGSLTVSSRTDASHQVVLSTTITVEDDGFLVPWLPHVFDQHGTENPVTGLSGTVSFDNGSTTIEQIKSVEFEYDPKVTDFDDFYGADSNRGRANADKAEVKCKVEMVLAANVARKIVQAKEFTTFAVQVVLGSTSAPYYRFDAPKVQFMPPPVELPDTGPVILTLEGTCLQSAAGQLDAFSVRILPGS